VLTARPYPHAYYVDGEMSVRDAQIDDKWHTVLAGSLGAGGKGFFILDITDPNLDSETANTGEQKGIV
jgi:type IV pilus assembly protein PilY1